MVVIPYIISFNLYSKLPCQVNPFVIPDLQIKSQDVEGLSNFLKVKQLLSGRGGMQTQGTAPPKASTLYLPSSIVVYYNLLYYTTSPHNLDAGKPQIHSTRE